MTASNWRVLNPEMGTVDMQTGLDNSNRRCYPRHEVCLPMKLQGDQGELAATTLDVSAKGVLFYMDCELGANVDSEIQFVITLPPEITLGTSMPIRCQGKVVRKTSGQQGLTIAAEIHHYEFLPTTEPA